ncbi:LppU/SCO3897 family protein [Lentzea sp.]|uniref:LppU/SCO3897 family protein n=1 Tax=Lentzea sp. TaxID=56099 RepID=UPI002ED52985
MKKVGLGIAAVVALLLLGGFVLHQLGDVAKTARAGDCARISGALDSPRYQALDCGSEQANVKVAKVLQWNESKCPSGGMDYSTYTGDSTLCLMPNFVQGSCYGQDAEAGIAKVDCATKDAVKVDKVLTGSTDGAACGDSRAAVFPEPAVTFCLHRGDQRKQ